MMQKLLTCNKPITVLLQAIDPSGIANESVCRTVEIVMILVEQLNLQVKELQEENQRLRDENNRLKEEEVIVQNITLTTDSENSNLFRNYPVSIYN